MNTPKAKHTPGPWDVCLYNRAILGGETSRDGCRVTVADLPTMYGPLDANPVSEANARLIAAAPDLLAVLEGLVNSVDEYGLRDHAGATITEKETATAHAAIAKARGTE